MRTQVESLQVVERENAALEASNSALEQQLSATHSPTTSADSKPASSGSTASGWQTFNDQFLHVVGPLLRPSQLVKARGTVQSVHVCPYLCGTKGRSHNKRLPTLPRTAGISLLHDGHTAA